MDFWLLGSLFLIGITASISPCPLATNIAAIGFISQSFDHRKKSIIAAALYSLGRILAYVMIGLLLSKGLAAAPALSYWLQEELPIYLGPCLMITGLIILGYIPFFSLGKQPDSRTTSHIIERLGIGGSFVLGFLFALAICPPSAALFFGTALPLSMQGGSNFAWLGISLFGLGTALPVVLIGILAAIGLKQISQLTNLLPSIQLWVKRVTGALFLIIGGYFLFSKILLV